MKTQNLQKGAGERKDSRWSTTQHRGLIRYVPSGTFFARIRVKGKLVRRSLKTTALSVAVLRLADLEREERRLAESESRVAGGKLTFGDAEGQLLKHLDESPNVKPRTRAYYRERLDALHRSWPGLRTRELRRITRAECKAWSVSFARTAAPSGFNHTAGILKKVFEIGIEHGAIYTDPAAGIARIKERRKELRLPTADQFLALVAAIGSSGVPHCHESADLVQLLAYTGMRKMEASHLRWPDVDFNRGEIVVRGDPVTGTKNNEERRVPMTPDARNLLVRLHAKRGDTDSAGPVTQVVDVRKALAKGCREIGIPRLLTTTYAIST